MAEVGGGHLAGLLAAFGLGMRGSAGRLTAIFPESVVLYDPAAAYLKLPLDVKNEGNRTLTIFKVDAGCSCRQADPAQLPMEIKPGGSKRVTIGLSGSRSFLPDRFLFSFSTNMGSLVAPATISTLPRHHLSPESFTVAGLNEVAKPGEGIFEMVHRQILDHDKSEEATPDLPAGLVAERLGASEGRVADAPGLRYRDVTYRLAIEDRSLGLHRADVGLKGADQRKILSIPVVWQRSPFLSTIPERVVLSPRTTRVFLRCVDESVEIARVVSVPPGVKAVQDSPRSVAVSLTDGTPDVMDGLIEVETTAKGRGSLRDPVIRYAPKPAG